MKALIVQFPFGFVAFDEQKQFVDRIVYAKKPQAAAKMAAENQLDQLSDDVVALITQLQSKGYDTFIFENTNLANQAQEKFSVAVEIAQPNTIDSIRMRMEEIAIETGFVKDAKELSLWMHNVSMEMAKIQVKGATEKRDLVIGQAIQTLDDLDRTVNLFMGRLREWYGVHFPELDRLVEKHETYARLVLDLGIKDNFTAEALEKEDIPKNKTEQISRIAASSMGAGVSETDLIQIQALSKNIIDTYKLRESMETYLNKTMEEVAPNTKTIAGALLGARLIALAGGLENLAKRPASTMQVLGAEKALFRSIKTGARPPKHGLIFQHTLLHDAKRWQRGKIARAIAGKLAIAIRADAFGNGHYIGDKLKADLDRRIEEINQKYPEPPPLKEQKPREERPREFRERRDFGRGGSGGGGFRDRRGGGYVDKRGGGGYGRDTRGGSGGGGFRDRRGGSDGVYRHRDSSDSGGSTGGGYFKDRRSSGGDSKDNTSSSSGGFRDRGKGDGVSKSGDRAGSGFRDRGSGGFSYKERSSGSSGGDRRDRPSEQKWRQNRRANKS